MSNGIHRTQAVWGACALPLLCLGVLGTIAPRAPAHVPARSCQVWVTDTIFSGMRAVPVTAQLAQEVGDSVTASFPAESNLSVTEARLGAAPRTVDLVLDAAVALLGDWTLTVRGTTGMCTGTVTVVGVRPQGAL